MTIRINMHQPPCAHQYLTLKGRYLTMKGGHLTRSRELYTCNACGESLVRTLNTFVPYWLPPHDHATVTRLSASSATLN